MSTSEFITEVRDALAGLDSTKIPDSTIVQARDRFVEPTLNDLLGDKDPDQNVYEGAVIAWTAEKTFDAWFAKTRMRDRSLEVFTRPQLYQEKLRKRTNEALYSLGVSRPPDYINHTETVGNCDE